MPGTARPTSSEEPSFLLGVEVAPGLGTLLGAIDSQTWPRDLVHVILVDGGTDPAATGVATEWMRTNGDRAELIAEANGRLGARNAVLTRATSDHAWVSFPEAPDSFDADYLRRIAAVTARHPQASAVVARQWRVNPANGDLARVPLIDAAFDDAHDAVVHLRRQPEDSPVAARATFVRPADVNKASLRFDPRLAAGFADQAFYLRLLASQDDPVSVFADVPYLFSERDDETAGGREGFTRPERFTDVVEHGHLALLRSFGGRGDAPQFVQHGVLLDLGWYFRADEGLTGQMNAEMHHLQDRFHALVTEVMALIDPVVLDSIELPRMPLDRHVALRYGYPGEDWHEDPVILEKRDPRQGLNRLSYRFAGRLPAEQVFLDGEPAAPRYAKTRTVVYAGRVLAYERILWVSAAGRLSLTLDGQLAAISRTRSPRRRTSWSPRAVADAFAARSAGTAWASSPRALVRRFLAWETWRSWLVRALAQSPPVRRRYGGSWVLMDRVESGHDNAEHLFAHMQSDERSIRSWFAVEKGSKDWKRLKSQGFKHLLAYGSLKWMLVCLNASHVVSSQAGPYVDNPQALRPIRRPSWRFIFLQHGVIATDLHRWLNRRQFDMFVTTTTDEFAAIAGDHSLYRFTPHEVALTGLPRHDRLVRLDASLPKRQRNRILVLPTWREYLLGTGTDGAGRRPLRDDFAQTTYARAWFGLLRSDGLRDLAQEHGATIAFMPHPNIQPYLDQFALPPYVETLTYSDNDIQHVLTSAKVVITDFSSIVFDAAYIGRPVVYYQFDQAEAFGGRHTVRQGYFSYEDDGFGPVVHREGEVVEALRIIAAEGFEASPEHAARRDKTFPVRDDGSSARVVAAVRALDRQLDLAEGTTQVSLPVAAPNRPTPRDVSPPDA